MLFRTYPDADLKRKIPDYYRAAVTEDGYY